ncbi:hypothetical protein GQ53DRAFT_217392 [Thozetella sp. PMI_491]|nr:hypothetical protein GQ53DRAFT_217392 [Thozetella sp. PMI_491]
MASPTNFKSPFRRASFALEDEEPSFRPRSGSALAMLIKDRSSGPSFLALMPGRDEENSAVDFPARARLSSHESLGEARRVEVLNGPHMRSMRLIGNSNPRYRWERYWKTQEQLAQMKTPIRKYYERTNYLVQQYLYIDRLLDSSLPHDLLNEYNVLTSISEEPPSPRSATSPRDAALFSPVSDGGSSGGGRKVRRTPKDIYRPSETTPLFERHASEDDSEGHPDIPWLEDDEDVDSSAPIVTVAIYVNFLANAILLAGKIAVVLTVPSVSVLASLVDAALDFLSTVIVWTTTWLISQQDQYKYPVGRRRLEPLGVLVFSVVMITSFVQVSIEAIQRLMSPEHEVIQLGVPAIAIMLSTIVIKGSVWVWCRLVKNSSVQALAADASTDVIFNAGSIAFPLAGFYLQIWWLDALGGLLLSLVVIYNWSQTSSEHIRHLTGFSATADQRNILLYLTMRFAKTIQKIQGLQAYHAGDKLNVEVDIVLDANTSLKDSHDLSESLQYVLESVPVVDRAFVHVDYASWNLPTHMEQQAR